jgi:hypothetical protein
MLNAIDFIVGTVAIMINLVVFVGALPISARARIALTALVGAWVGLATLAGANGALAFSPGQPIPLVGLFVAAPLAAVAALWLLSPSARAALMSVPTSVLIGLNSMRVLGALFLALAAAGRLSGPFPYSAGLGDVITGLAAIPLTLALSRGARDLDASIRGWNLFGVLDLFAAIALGLTSAEGSPVQIVHGGAGSEAMQHLPFSLVPTVLVPFYLITHAIIAAQLAERRRARGDIGALKAAT